MDPINLNQPVEESTSMDEIIKIPSSNPPSVDKVLIILFSILTILILCILVILGYYFNIIKSDFLDNVSLNLSNITSSSKTDPSRKICPKGDIILQQVTNVGYSFLLGQIDYPDSPALGDDLKNNITQVIYKAKFPKKLLNNVAIVIVNTLAIKPNETIGMPAGNVYVPDFNPDFLTGGGIIYFENQTLACSSVDTFLYGKTSMIYINSKMLSSISDILTHELGHFIGDRMSYAEWMKFYQLRNIPKDTPRQGPIWSLSPGEDFAEVYKNTYTSLDIKTYWGSLKPRFFNTDIGPCAVLVNNLMSDFSKKDQTLYKSYNEYLKNYITDQNNYRDSLNQNSQIQDCRRNVASNPDKYSKDASLGSPYISIVDQPTKDFIIEIVNKLNSL